MIINFVYNSYICGILNSSFNAFKGNGFYYVLLLFSIVYVILCTNQKNIQIIFGYQVIIILILINIPLFSNLVVKLIGEEVYWRVYWMIPIGYLLGYILTKLIISEQKIKIFKILIVLVILLISGENIYISNTLIKINNLYKIDNNLIDIMLYMKKIDNDYKVLAGPKEFIIYGRTIDGTTNLSELRLFNYEYGSITTMVKENRFYDIYEYCWYYSVNYLVLNKYRDEKEDSIYNYFFEKIYENDKYELFHFDESKMKINGYEIVNN